MINLYFSSAGLNWNAVPEYVVNEPRPAIKRRQAPVRHSLPKKRGNILTRNGSKRISRKLQRFL